MNRKEFCEYLGIPYRTVTEWERGTRKMPDYVFRLMEYQIRMEKIGRENTKECADGKSYNMEHYNLDMIISVGCRVKSRRGIELKQVFSVVEQFTVALDLLDDYDHQRIEKPKGKASTYILTYEECKEVIANMKFSADSALFGNEKDDYFAGSIGSIYQTFGELIFIRLQRRKPPITKKTLPVHFMP